MFISKETPDALASMETLPSVRLADLHPEVREVLRKESGFVNTAVRRIVAYVMATDGVPASAITLQRLVAQDAIYAAYLCSRTFNLRGGFRRFLLATGHFGAADKLLAAPPKKVHPVLLEWLDTKTIDDRHKANSRLRCMEFLKWLCNEQFPMYRPEDIPVQFLVREYLVSYRRHLIQDGKRRRLKPASQKRHMQQIVAWVRWLCHEGKIAEIDTTGLAIRKSKSRPRRLPSHSELSLFFQDLFEHESELYVIPFILMLCTGARPNEVINLTFSQLDMVQRRIYLQSKNGPGRWIPISANVWKTLDVYFRSRHTNSICSAESRVFLHSNGRHFTYDTLRSPLKRQRCIAMDGMMAFRHRFATDCYKSKMPVRVFQYVMGHKGLSEMSRYQHEDRTFLDEEIRGAFDDGEMLV